MKGEFKVGSVVRSVAGRDKDKNFMVAQIVGDEYVLLIDGKLRKISSPKLKKVKHLRLTGLELPEIADRFVTGKRLSDKEISDALKECLNVEVN